MQIVEIVRPDFSSFSKEFRFVGEDLQVQSWSEREAAKVLGEIGERESPIELVMRAPPVAYATKKFKLAVSKELTRFVESMTLTAEHAQLIFARTAGLIIEWGDEGLPDVLVCQSAHSQGDCAFFLHALTVGGTKAGCGMVASALDRDGDMGHPEMMRPLNYLTLMAIRVMALLSCNEVWGALMTAKHSDTIQALLQLPEAGSQPRDGLGAAFLREEEGELVWRYRLHQQPAIIRAKQPLEHFPRIAG